jgi:hypothetical protein
LKVILIGEPPWICSLFALHSAEAMADFGAAASFLGLLTGESVVLMVVLSFSRAHAQLPAAYIKVFRKNSEGWVDLADTRRWLPFVAVGYSLCANFSSQNI